jgi:hypothetical protein
LKRHKKIICAAFLAVGLPGLSHAQTLKEESRLLDKPSGAAQGAAIVAGTGAKVLERQGFWVRVEASGRSGWLKASALNFSSGSGGPTAIDTGRLGTGNIVSASSARGLSAKDLLNGTPRPEEVAKLNQLMADAAAVQAFITQGEVTALAQAVMLKAPPPAVAAPAADGGRNARTEASTALVGGASNKANDDW